MNNPGQETRWLHDMWSPTFPVWSIWSDLEQVLQTNSKFCLLATFWWQNEIQSRQLCCARHTRCGKAESKSEGPLTWLHTTSNQVLRRYLSTICPKAADEIPRNPHLCVIIVAAFLDMETQRHSFTQTRSRRSPWREICSCCLHTAPFILCKTRLVKGGDQMGQFCWILPNSWWLFLWSRGLVFIPRFWWLAQRATRPFPASKENPTLIQIAEIQESERYIYFSIFHLNYLTTWFCPTCIYW